MDRKSESGNVMFYIFAGIALLAALSYAVAQGSRSSATSLTEDRARLYAAEVMAYGDAVAKAVSTLRLRGIAPGMIEFDTPLLAGYDNPACGEASCAVYQPGGGDVNYTAPPGDWLDRSFAGQAEHGNAFFDGTTCVPNVGTGDASCGGDATDNEELTMFVPFINRTVCLTINELANVNNPGGEPPELDDCAWATKFTGSFAEGVALTGGTADALSGHSAGCVRVTASCAGMGDSHHYFQVLVAR